MEAVAMLLKSESLTLRSEIPVPGQHSPNATNSPAGDDNKSVFD